MTARDIEALVRPNIRKLTPYSTARDELKGCPDIFLDANESPYPSLWNRYPDPRQKAVKARICEIRGAKVENIFVGNGSDEAVDLIFRVFCIPSQDNIVAIAPSYGMYGVSAAINDIEVRQVQLGDDFSLDAEEVLAKCDTNTKAIFLCSPNNPSGNALDRSEIEKILNEAHCIVVIDEAYIDFSDKGSFVPCIDRWPNLIVLQTLSKAFGLAALRMGIAYASEYITGLFSMVKFPYNISAANQNLALEALKEPVTGRVREIKEQRERVIEALRKFSCIKKIYPSDANFILVKTDDATRLYWHLLADGVIVRDRSHVKGCEGCLRITIGLESENDVLLKSIEKFLTV